MELVTKAGYKSAANLMCYGISDTEMLCLLALTGVLPMQWHPIIFIFTQPNATRMESLHIKTKTDEYFSMISKKMC